MDVYLPIANMSVNGLLLVALGALTGILSGLFGVGGGFLTTPLLSFCGVPPTVAAASAATQVTGASVSGVLAHNRRGGVDYRMGSVMVVGGIVGALIGSLLFRLFHERGVRVFPPNPVADDCSCNRERIKGVLSNFSAEEITESVEDGEIAVTCEFCGESYSFDSSEFTDAESDKSPDNDS